MLATRRDFAALQVIALHIAITDVIGEDDQNVWLGLRRQQRQTAKHDAQTHPAKHRFHRQSLLHVPRLGKFSVSFSRVWKKSNQIFQALEIFTSNLSKPWKK
ncbi:MAG: hypothetical protein NTY53_16330 [Kiritimatiellaeota bacterium]|nr:hypothetical protein [Kiritimatiellota bacterium]